MLNQKILLVIKSAYKATDVAMATGRASTSQIGFYMLLQGSVKRRYYHTLGYRHERCKVMFEVIKRKFWSYHFKLMSNGTF